MLQIALRAALLATTTPQDALRAARDLGADGVEFDLMPDFADHLRAIALAAGETGVRVAALNAGHTRLISPHYAEREAELVRLREAMAQAVDLGAQGVIFYGHFQPGPALPDLFPYRTPSELEAELLVTMLRTTLCDHAYAMGTELLLAPAQTRETHLIRRVAHAARIKAALNHPRELRICASLAQMAAEGEALADALAAGSDLGYLHVRAGLSGFDLAGVARALSDAGYTGWLCLDAAPDGEAGLRAAISALRLS